MNFNCANVNVKSCKQKREAGTFVDFKKLESPLDNDFEIDGEAFLQLFHDDNEVIKCLFPDSTNLIEALLNLPDRSMMENPLAMSNIEQHQE